MAVIQKYLSLLLTCTIAPLAAPARAACPVELAIYGDPDHAAEIDFTPKGVSATVTNTFVIVLDKGTVLTGIVRWNDERARRPYGTLMYQCPEGDVTGDELAACTVWEGVIYTADQQGKIDLLPAEGVDAPKKLIFPDLGPSLRRSAAYGANGSSTVPWDVFEMTGCQE